MTEKEAVDALDAIKGDDPVQAHVKSDQVLLKFLREAGYIHIYHAWLRCDDRARFQYE